MNMSLIFTESIYINLLIHLQVEYIEGLYSKQSISQWCVLEYKGFSEFHETNTVNFHRQDPFRWPFWMCQNCKKHNRQHGKQGSVKKNIKIKQVSNISGELYELTLWCHFYSLFELFTVMSKMREKRYILKMHEQTNETDTSSYRNSFRDVYISMFV